MAEYVKDHRDDGKFLWLTMEADAEVFRSEYLSHFNRVVQKLSVPGFRRGHAPMDMSIQYMKNRGSFGRELETVVGQVIEKTVVRMSEVDKEWDERIFGLPVENKVSDFDLGTWHLRFESKFEKFPEITLADYSKIETLIEHKEPNLDLCPCTEDKEAEPTDVVAVSMVGKTAEGEQVYKYMYDMLEVDLETTKINKKIVKAIVGAKARDRREVSLKDGGREVKVELWIIEVRRKTKVDEELVSRLRLRGIDTTEKLREAIKKQHDIHNSYVRYQDILKWLSSQANRVEPFPVEGVKREASKTYHSMVKRGQKNVSFDNIFFDHSKNLKTTLVLDAISKREKIEIGDEDRAEFAKDIEEHPWIYGNRGVEDIFNCPEEVLREYITQFKTIRMLIGNWHFSK